MSESVGPVVSSLQMERKKGTPEAETETLRWKIGLDYITLKTLSELQSISFYYLNHSII